MGVTPLAEISIDEDRRLLVRPCSSTGEDFALITLLVAARPLFVVQAVSLVLTSVL
jgi:hypothetical protein